MHELAPIIHDLAVILGVAGIVTLIFQKIHQPVVLGYLVAGMIVGPHTPPHAFVSDGPNIQIIAELGVIFLMFSLGLEFSFHKLTKVGFSASVTGLIEVISMMTIGFFTGNFLGWSYYDSIFLGSALAISSTTIIIKAIEELNLKTKRFTEVVFGILIVEDLLAILVLVALSTVVATQNIMSTAMLWATIKLVSVVTSWFLVGYFLVPIMFRKVMIYASTETLTIVSIALCLLLVVIATHFHYSTALGAFIMGSILAETPQITRIKELIEPVRDIFAAVFFVSVGMMIDPKMIIAHWPIVLLISAVTIIGKIITSGVGAFLTGQSINNSLRIGFSMAQIGEFSFIIISLGVAIGVISAELYAIIVAVSGITTFTTPYLIRFSGYLGKKIEAHVPQRTKYLLENYSAWIYKALASSQQQKAQRYAMIRFLINAIIVAIIFILVDRVFQPARNLMVLDSIKTIKVITWFIAFALSSPFIFAMLFTFKLNPKISKWSSIIFLIIAWSITIFGILILSVSYFYTWTMAGIGLSIGILFFIIFYRKIKNCYFWFEKRLITNLGLSFAQKKDPFRHLARWDIHLSHMTVMDDSPLIGKTLTDAQFRNRYGINIVAIQRGSKTFFAPRGNQELMPNDKLIILGNDEQLDQIRPIIEKKEGELEADIMNTIKIRTLEIDRYHPNIGQTIRDSYIRETNQGIVVGLERKGIPILNPDPAAIVLEENDLLYILINKTS